MTATTFIAVLVALVVALAIVRIFERADYACPICGSRREDRHASECPWKRGSPS